MIVGLAATRWGQWAGVAKVVVDSELVWFKVRGPHPEFEKQVSYGPAGVMSPVS